MYLDRIRPNHKRLSTVLLPSKICCHQNLLVIICRKDCFLKFYFQLASLPKTKRNIYNASPPISLANCEDSLFFNRFIWINRHSSMFNFLLKTSSLFKLTTKHLFHFSQSAMIACQVMNLCALKLPNEKVPNEILLYTRLCLSQVWITVQNQNINFPNYMICHSKAGESRRRKLLCHSM